MAISVCIPKLGLTMTEATIVEWRKKEGERVEKGEILAVIETEKITFEIESPGSGFLGKILALGGATVPVGNIIGHILSEGEKPVEAPAIGGLGNEVQIGVSENVETAEKIDSKKTRVSLLFGRKKSRESS